LLPDQRRGRDHLEVLLSLVYRLMRCLFGLLERLYVLVFIEHGPGGCT
jgi:hypothetical protein